MKKKLEQCLHQEQGSYIIPFLWLHGEPQERVYEEIVAIKNSGIHEFCAESRPYQNFGRDEWWEDFGFILKSAKELGMRVWLLDDKKFPTGYANGYLSDPSLAHLRKRQIREAQSEVIGPMRKAKIYVGGWLKKPCERIVSVTAFRHCDEREQLDPHSAIDLTRYLDDSGMIYWDVPAGVWRVCVMIETDANVPESSILNYYVDMLNPESCRAMIEAVYEPNYQHFKEYFGNTFAGFFSDEPGFCNRRGTYADKLGIMGNVYPWREDLPRLIAESAGADEATVALWMPAMWEDLGEATALIRSHYMEVVTKLYCENLTMMLGEWCHAHGVMYIGHVIEDEDCHMRMAYGSGHFFRALKGQDMSGIDVVLMQEIPGFQDSIHRAPIADGGIADPAFFRYTMPKLGASCAHVDPRKQGRAMCEIFGAFGWVEGLPYMKGLADIMLASGINYYVPHAFSPKEEDPDCPPHFYNGGRNVQYPYFKHLMSYMGRCAHLISDCMHCADVAVFYNAEGDWSGGKNQLFRHVCKALTRRQIDFDIVPEDTLASAEVKDNLLCINGEIYRALIVSESEVLPRACLEMLAELAEKGLPVIFTETLPKRASEGGSIEDINRWFEVLPTNALADTLRARGLTQLSATGEGVEYLRFYHTKREGSDLYVFSNEAVYSDLSAEITLPQTGDCLVYDPWSNRIYRDAVRDGKLTVQIEKGNLLIYVFGTEIDASIPTLPHEIERIALPLRFEIAVKEEGESDYRVIATDAEPFDVTAHDRLPDFSGEVRYRATFEAVKDFTVLDLGEVGEVAEVWLNGVSLGVRINAPYKFSLLPTVKEGVNELEIKVIGNPAHRRHRDNYTRYVQIPPTGIVGELALCRYGSKW